ncbi:hypothetical protein [Haloarchaeobius sp. HRN-SO-5]|uniref:hypothetical protein n=1 Tax=Haloarchaeobius sp. HRN-SO-5 TaxID=3446118 RepID=UPI003EBD1D03
MPSTRDEDLHWVVGELPRLLLGVVLILFVAWFVESAFDLVSMLFHGLLDPFFHRPYDPVRWFRRLGDWFASVVRWTGLLALGGYVVRRATA